MRRKELYKVVRVLIDGTRLSVFAGGRYCREYRKDEIVEAEPGSYGIMLFETLKDARLFVTGWYSRIIIKVQPIGRGKRVTLVSIEQDEDDLQEFYKRKPGTSQRNDISLAAPIGTICYPKVKVLG